MNAKFCSECGTPTTGAKFCPECGHPTSAAADVSSATRHSSVAEDMPEQEVWSGTPDPMLTPVAAKSHKYRLTTQRLLVEQGLVGKRADSLDLFRVKDVQVKKSITQRARGRGDVTVHSTDVSSPALVLQSVESPDVVAEQIRSLVREVRQQQNVSTREIM